MTTQSLPRPSRLLFVALAALIGGIALSMLYVGQAHAAGVDPVATANAATADSWDLVAQYGPIWGIGLLLFGLLTKLLATNQSTHWIADGRKLAVLTGLSMVAASALDWHFHGAPLAGVVITAIMAIKLVWSPTVTPAAPARNPQAGRVLPVVMLWIGGIALGLGIGAAAVGMSGCGAVQHGETALINCIGEEIGTTPAADMNTVLAIAALVENTRQSCTPAGGSLDWVCVESAAISHGKQIGGCAISELVQLYLTPAPGRAAPPAEKGLAARGALEDFRRKYAGGAAFQTKQGPL